jgi:hypothetical protein
MLRLALWGPLDYLTVWSNSRKGGGGPLRDPKNPRTKCYTAKDARKWIGDYPAIEPDLASTQQALGIFMPQACLYHERKI